VALYDEHSGLYDHVPPPPAVPLDGHALPNFGFERLGVRVPAHPFAVACRPRRWEAFLIARFLPAVRVVVMLPAGWPTCLLPSLLHQRAGLTLKAD
jgi:hypothetical protein